jgi:hypothetical protein
MTTLVPLRTSLVVRPRHASHVWKPPKTISPNTSTTVGTPIAINIMLRKNLCVDELPLENHKKKPTTTAIPRHTVETKKETKKG